MPSNQSPHPADALLALVHALVHAAGVPDDDAAWLARCLVETDLWGVSTHGVAQLPSYLDGLITGDINPTPAVTSVCSLGALETCDADGGLGFVAARFAMNRAITLAAEHGVALVSVTNSTHFGAAGLYAMMAAERGMIGVAISNAVPSMAAAGGAGAIVGNNPLSIAAPRGTGAPFVFDSALSVTAWANVRRATQRSEAIPVGWGMDAAGHPTDDPSAVRTLAPAGGAKGLGLAYCVDLLTGVMTGGAQLTGVEATGRMGNGSTHTMMAIDAGRLGGEESLDARVDEFVDAIRASPTLSPDHPGIRAPGDRRAANRDLNSQSGVVLEGELRDQLVEWCRRLAVAPSASFVR